MRFSALSGMLLLALSAAAVDSRAADDAASVNPVGKPKKFAVAKETTYAVWFADGAWHIVATAKKGDFAKFQGSVKVDGGELTEGTFDHLETNTKKRFHDWVAAERDKKSLRFIFANSGSDDGIDFKVSDSAQTLTFGLLLDGKTPPENVMIGAKSVHPATNPFTLPAHPDETAAPPAKKKKKAND